MNRNGLTQELQLCDEDELRRTLQYILPAGSVIEVRALEATTTSDRWPHTASGFFDDPEKLIEALATIRSAKGIYCTLNPVDPALLARAANRIRKAPRGESTTDRDIAERRWLLIDCDVQRPAGISATDDEHQAALDRAAAICDDLRYNCGWPDPVEADSGNGGHLLYRIDLPRDDAGLVQHCLTALAAQFDDDKVKIDTGVHNPARITKLYGTLVCKGDSTADRPHRMSRIFGTPDPVRIVDRALLESLVSTDPVEPIIVPHHATNGQAWDIDSFIVRHGFEVDGPDEYAGGRRWTFRQSPLCEHHGDGPFLIQLASGALSAGCHHNSCSWTWHDLRAKFEPKPDASLYDRLINKVSGNGQSNGEAVTPPPVESRTIEYARITSAELASGNYSVDYLIEHTLVAGQPLIVAGPQKTLKTSLLVDAAVSLATAGFFLGKLRVNRKSRVAVMSGECGLATIQETARRVCDAAGRQLAELDHIVWSPDIPKFGSRDHLESLDKFLTADAVEVLLVDPAYLAMPSNDAGNLMAQGELLRGMNELCQRLGVTLGLCHHAKKNTGRDPYEPMELQDIAWAGFAEFARQWWLLNRREKYEPGAGEHKLWLSVGGSAGHSALWALDVSEGSLSDPGGRHWDVSLSKPDEAREEAARRQRESKAENQAQQLDVDRKAVVEALAALPDRMGTKTDIRTVSPFAGTRFDSAFASLLRDRSLLPTKITKGNQRLYDGYKLGN